MIDLFQFDSETAESIAKSNAEQGIFAQPRFRMMIELKGLKHKGQKSDIAPYGEIELTFNSAGEFVTKLWDAVKTRIKRQILHNPEDVARPFSWGPEERTEADMRHFIVVHDPVGKRPFSPLSIPSNFIRIRMEGQFLSTSTSIQFP
jgi:hypothetical protein